jgi:hypothetical protein
MNTTEKTEELRGTFACPICGYDKPHAHSEEEQKAYHEEQLRGQFPSTDGWNRTAIKKPTMPGWYLCRGIEIPPDQYGVKKDFWTPNQRYSQLSWFLWCRKAGQNGCFGDEVPEVLYFSRESVFSLRNFLGDAVPSGHENRRRVVAYPKYWREIPSFEEVMP